MELILNNKRFKFNFDSNLYKMFHKAGYKCKYYYKSADEFEIFVENFAVGLEVCIHFSDSEDLYYISFSIGDRNDYESVFRYNVSFIDDDGNEYNLRNILRMCIIASEEDEIEFKLNDREIRFNRYISADRLYIYLDKEAEKFKNSLGNWRLME